MKLEKIHWATHRSRDGRSPCPRLRPPRPVRRDVRRAIGTSPAHIPYSSGGAAPPRRRPRTGATTVASFSTAASARARSTSHRQGAVDWPARWNCRSRARCASRAAPTWVVRLREWPVEHRVKCLASTTRTIRPSCARSRRAGPGPRRRLPPHRSRSAAGGDPGKSAAPVDDTHARPCDRPLLRARRPSGLVEAAHPGSDAAWNGDRRRHRQAHDPNCRGVLLLGLDAPEPELVAAFAMARRHPVCKGFAVGRTIFGKPAEDWLGGRINDEQASRRWRPATDA